MAVETRAIVCRDTHAKGGWKMENVTVRKPGDGELLVEIVGSGVCHTDALAGSLEIGSSPLAVYPRVLGHEGAGYVKEVGPNVTVAKPGDAVLLSYSSCGHCGLCKVGKQSSCLTLPELNFVSQEPIFQRQPGGNIAGFYFGQSSFAQMSTVRQASVVNVQSLVKDKRELQLFSPLGCGIQTGSGTVILTAKATRDDAILIMGLGGVGLSAVMGAKIQGCRKIIGVDRVASRLKLATELGCTDTIDTSALGEKTLGGAAREIAGDAGPSIVIDTTGVPDLIKAGVEFTSRGGKYVQVGTPPFDFELPINMASLMLDGKQLLGAIEGQAHPPDFVPKLIEWYREGRLPIDKLIKFIPAEEFDHGLKEMHDGTTIKPVLCWS